MPSTTILIHKQGGMVTTEELLPQQHRPAHRHNIKDTPLPQTDRPQYSGEPIAHFGYAKGPSSKDRNQYHLDPSSHQAFAPSPTVVSSARPPHSASPPRLSSTDSYESSVHLVATVPENPTWSRSSPFRQDKHSTSSPTAIFRLQPRASPLDPPMSSSPSSASPSPSISTITAASTPMTTDGITAVTKRTAAASLNDSRPKQSLGRPLSIKEEPIDCYEGPGEPARSPTGGLVQPAVKRLSGDPPSIRQPQPQPQQHPSRPSSSAYGPDETMSSSSAKLARGHSPDYHLYPKDIAEHPFPSAHHRYDTARGPFAAYEQPYQPHPSGNRPSGPYPPSSSTPSSSARPRHPEYEPTHLSFHSRPAPHYPPSSPRSMARDEPSTRERTREWPTESHRDPRLNTNAAETVPPPPRHGQGYRDLSYSPPAPYPYDTHPSLHYPPFYHPHYPHYPPYPPHPSHQPPHPSLQQQQHPPPLYDPVRESDQRIPQHPGLPPAMYSSYPDPHSPRVAYYRAQRRGYAVASGYPEAPSPRLAHSQQHGLVARPERLTSPGPAHPYHASRSYHSHSADSTFASYPSVQHRRAAEDDIRMARRGSASQLLHSHDQRHHYPPLSPQPQPRYPRDSTHARTHTHGSPEHAFDGHGSLERMQGQGLDGRDLAAAARAAYDGRWDAESLHRMRRRRGDYETISEPQSASLASAAAAPHRREVQRGIRPSVSESDLASAELKRDRERRMGGPLGEEAAAVDVGEDRLDDEEELAYRRMHFAGSYPLHHLLDDPRHHMSREEYMYAQQQQQQQHLRHLRYPYHHEQQHPAHHEQHHAPYPHEYDPHYDPQRHAQRGGAALADGHPSSQCTQAGSSSSLSADQQQKQKQQQQQQKQQKKQSSAATSGAPTGASSGVPSGASSQPRPNNPMQGNFPPRMLPPLHPRDLPTLLPYHTTRPGSNNGQQPKMPMRRGPYLSKQRALLAGYELPSPSSRYQCQYCSKRFSRPSSLRIHTYSHTGERPFKCSEEGCGRQFSVQSNMRRHLRVHRMGRMRSEYADPEQEQEQDQQQESEHENENEHEDEQDFE